MNIITSGLPVAIGTSLALESYLPPTKRVYDLSRVIPIPTNPIKYFNTLYINVYTLARNLVNATTTDYSVSILVSRLRSEAHWINEYVESVSPKTKIQFYIHGVSRTLFPNSIRSRVRINSTAKSKAKHRLLSKLVVETAKDRTLNVVSFTDGIEGDIGANSLVLTNFPLDILKFKTHKDIVQLSSHTGLELNRQMFHKLYHQIPSKDMVIFPFNVQLWKFLGDKVLIKPAPIAQRKRLYDLALTKKWSPATTLLKIKSNLRDEDLELYGIIFNSK